MFKKIIEENKVLFILAAIVLVSMFYYHVTNVGIQEGDTDKLVRQYFGGGIQINNATLYSGRVYQNPQCDCDPCTVWSTCTNGIQIRSCPKCDTSTNMMCRIKMEEIGC